MLLSSSDEVMSCCAAGTNWCLDLRCRAALSGADVQDPWQGVLESGSIAMKPSRLDACEDWKVVRWRKKQGSSHSSQGLVDDRISEAGESTAATERSALLCC